MWHDGPDGWGWVLMAIMMALFWVPLLVAVVWLARRFGQPAVRGSNGGDGHQLDAREIARRTYARGEYSREQFLEIMEDLHGPGSE
jgi:uncharacterized membrane protein